MGTLSIQPGSGGIDTYLQDTDATSDFGDSTVLYIGLKTGKASVKYRALLYFDCSSIPSNAIVNSVTFTTWSGALNDYSASKPCTVYQARKNFTADANWNTYDGTTAWTVPGGDYNASPSASFTLTQGQTITSATLAAIVQDAVTSKAGALRLLIKADDESSTQGYAVWKSMDNSTSGNKPKLEVSYTARIQWTGNTDGDAETATNWSPELVPSAGDVAQFCQGSNPCTTGTITCDTMTVSGNYTGELGTSSSPITVEASKVVVNKRNGGVHLNIGTTSTTDVYLDGTPAGDSNATLSGTITNLYALNCTGQVQVSADVGTAYLIPASRKRTDIQLTATADDADVIAKNNSKLVAQGELDTTHIWGGATVTVHDSSSNQMGAVKIRDGGTLKYLGSDASSTLGFGSTVKLYGGELTLDKSTAPAISFTGQVTTYADSILNARNSVDAAEFASSIKYYGGRIRIDASRKATPA